ARHRVAIACHRHQTGTRYPRRLLDITVKRFRHGHQVRALMVEHLGHTELPVLGMPDFVPQRPAPRTEPRIEFDDRAEALLARLDPDATPAVLHVLLDDSLLPTGGDVTEVGIEQVVRAHHRKARVDDPALALLDL